MTRDNTTESSPWCAPGETPTDEAPAPPLPEADAPASSALGAHPGYGVVRTPSYAPPPGKGMSLGTLWTGVGSLVLGVLSIGVLGIVGGIFGLVLGMVTLRRADRGTATGSETATFGMALSLVSIVLGVLLFTSAWPAVVDAFEQGWEQGIQP
ncbi:MAG: DUF4190 domain-containing protein [Cellulomonadaceae bacterium]|nr:DUF4190 domain-containing protein [Cellulomonadaceae bacterium]